MHLLNKMNELIKHLLPKMIDIRQQLHQIPELKFEEFKTASLIANILEAYGISAETGIAKTGIVAMIDSGKPGRTVALRADIDALPIHELTQLSYQSQHENKMHACGHDGHTATLLLVAYILHKMRTYFSGKVKLIFQPAEEGGKGSLAMITEGVLNEVDAIFGYHNWPGLATGTVGTRTGAILAGTGRIEISINGKVAHTSMPDKAINPVTIGAKITTALESLQQKYASKSAVINIIRFESGEMKGGMTDSAKIIGVYYVENDEILAEIKTEIAEKTQAITEKHGATHTLNFYEFHRPTINTKKEANLVLETAREVLGVQDVIELSKCMIAAEDFSEYLRIVPGCFFLVGAGENTPPVHTAHFDFPDSIMPVAALIMATTAINFLNRAI